MQSATFIVFILYITLQQVAAWGVGQWSLYRLQTQCTAEHIRRETLPNEGSVGFPSVRDKIECAVRCHNRKDCASMSMVVEGELVTCGLVDAEQHVCDDTTGMYRKVLSNQCENGGIWHNESKCLCPEGWAGPFCNILNPDECASDPCVWGDCEDLINLFRCHCYPGFDGTTCEIDIDECASSPCDSAHGTCIDGANEFTCDCQDGYGGRLCSVNTNCSPLINLFQCSCNPGFDGVLCENIIGNQSCSDWYARVIQTRDQGDVVCELNQTNTSDAGWTVIQRRVDDSVDFYRPWDAYVAGFGDRQGNFWLGLDEIAAFTSGSPVELIVYLETFENEWAYAHYSSFSVAGSEDNYRSSLSGYTGTAGDSLSRHNGLQFTTYDRDNDLFSSGNCAEEHTGAWWYASCIDSNLNARYLATSSGQSIYWRGFAYSLKTSVMKIR